MSVDHSYSKLDFVLIVTYGRSGSTLLQGILNTIPNACIRGENSNAVVRLSDYYRSLIQVKEITFNTNHTDTKDPWYGSHLVDMERTLDSLRREIVENILNAPDAVQLIGYKEIRYGRESFEKYEDLRDFIHFLRLAFPRLKIILNHRRKDHVLKSGWWPSVPSARLIIDDIEEKMHRIFRDFNQISYWLDYDKYKKNSKLLNRVFEFLDYSPVPELLRDVLNERHSI